MRKPLLMVVFGVALAGGTNAAVMPIAEALAPVAVSPIAAEPFFAGIEQNGQTVTLTTGQELAVALPDNPTSGFAWRLGDLDQGVLILDGDPQVRAAPGASGPVGPDTSVWTFAAVGPGVTTVTLLSVHPWDPAGVPDQQYTLNVVVR